MKLDINEVQFDSRSYTDPNGRLFHWRGDIYRAVTPQISAIYTSFLKDHRVQDLFKFGLIETEISSLQLEGYGIVLKHKRIPFESFGFEWCGQMLKDAALFVLDMNLKLSELGYELQDPTPWNVLFDGCVPYYVDFGSIVPISKSTKTWTPYKEFIKSFLNPLLLISKGKQREAREMMTDWRKWGVSDEDYTEMMPFVQKYGRKFLGSLLQAFPAERFSLLSKLQSMVSAIEFKILPTQWTEYYKDYVTINKPADWTPKQTVAYEVLSQMTPDTLLDIGSNTGWFSELGMNVGSKVIALDVDEGCIQILYERHRNSKQILPLVIDFSTPTKAHGQKNEFASATDRLQCDLVFALGVVHHLVFKQQMNFESIAEILRRFTKSTLLVEFIPKEDHYVSEWYNESYSWYTLDNFVQALTGGFSNINVLPSNRPPRSLLLCQGIK